MDAKIKSMRGSHCLKIKGVRKVLCQGDLVPERLKNLEKKREKEAAERKERERQVSFKSSRHWLSFTSSCLSGFRRGRGWSC